ncbi:Glutamate receptor ionotropic, kainate 4 [Halotydeus destructor]|nr:Glutamate receptor ionotropic, kainate 4 [Halotydeus destructor]
MKLIAELAVIGLIVAAAEASLSGKELTFVVALKKPFAEVVPEAVNSTGNDRYQGFVIDIVHALAASNDFQFKLMDAQIDGIVNGEVANVLGEVIKGNADVAIGNIFSVSKWGKYLEATDAIMSGGVSLLHRKRVVTSPGQRSMAYFFSAANYTTEFNTQVHQKYETVDQLLNSDAQLRLMAGSAAWTYLQNSTEPVSKRLWDRMYYVNSFGEALEKAKNENYALITETATAQYLMASDPCLYMIGDPIVDLQYVFMVRQGSALRKQLSQAILELQESGQIAELKRKWWKLEGDLTVGSC